MNLCTQQQPQAWNFPAVWAETTAPAQSLADVRLGPRLFSNLQNGSAEWRRGFNHTLQWGRHHLPGEPQHWSGHPGTFLVATGSVAFLLWILGKAFIPSYLCSLASKIGMAERQPKQNRRFFLDITWHHILTLNKGQARRRSESPG